MFGRRPPHRALILAALALAACAEPQPGRLTVIVRGQEQPLRLYGSPASQPVIVSSGDGGWIHLAPHVAEFLSSRGFFVVGFDVEHYLSGFTRMRSAVSPLDEPVDYRRLVDVARRTTGQKPMLIGISEGAGLSVLAATDPDTKEEISGVICLGLPDLNELGFRVRDMLIYLTHRAPNEPSFHVATIIDRVAPLPLAAIHSTHDEFVPVSEVERVLAAAHDPKRLWIVPASNHRFSDNLDGFDRQLLEAIAWVRSHGRP